jgi:hypothetical protein
MADLLELLKRYQTSPTKENEGVWAEIEVMPGVALEVLIASTDGQGWKNYVLEALGRLGDLDKLKDGEAERTQAEGMVGTVLLDWRNLSWDGQEIPFSREFAVELLTELRLFRESVMRLARDRKRFQDDNLEAVAERLAKNLPGGSATEASSARRPSKSGSKRASTPKAGTGG